MGEPVEQPPTKASAGRKSVVCLMRCMDVHEVDSLFVTFFFLEKKDILAFVRKKMSEHLDFIIYMLAFKTNSLYHYKYIKIKCFETCLNLFWHIFIT